MKISHSLPSRRELFVQKFRSTFFPILLSMLLLGMVSAAVVCFQAMDNAVTQSNSILHQAMQNMELLFGSVDTVALAVSQDANTLERIGEVFENQAEVDRESNLESERFLKFVSSTSNSIPYIFSVYVYVQNSHGKFMATDYGKTVARLDYYYDTGWYSSYLENRDDREVWTESRLVQRYSFEAPLELISRYRTIYPLGMAKRGVIVENVEKRKVYELLDSLHLLQGQQLQLYDDEGKLLLSYPEGEILEESFGQLRTEIPSQRFGWTYVSVIPYRMLFQSVSYLIGILFLILLCGLTFSLMVAFAVTRAKYQRALDIIRAVEKRNLEDFLVQGRKQDEYDYFLESMLREYMEKSDLEMTISEQKYQLRIMEILALQSQINPHFLFNTLEVIKWESIGLTHGENMVSRMLEDLSDVMGYALGDPHEMTTLREEIEVTKCYVQILQNRYPDKFDVDWYCSEHLLDWRTPKLIFQPLIENSVYHGIKEKPGFCRIRIKIYHRNGALIFRVTNNGVGMTRERLKTVRESLAAAGSPERIGLYNIAKRLSLLFPDRCTVQIFSKETLGTSVCIRIEDFLRERESAYENLD